MKRGFTHYAFPTGIFSNMKNVITFNIGAAPTVANTSYIAMGPARDLTATWANSDPSSPAGALQYRATMWPCAGTLKNLFVYMERDQPTGETMEITVMINGVASLLSAVQNGGNTGDPVLFSDTTHSAAINAGDVTSFMAVNSLGGDSGAMAVAYEFDPS